MIATITAALMSLYAAATAHAESIVRRIHDATLGLVLLDRQMVSGMAYTVVPEIMYREYKALYLELRTLGESPGRGGGGVRGAPAIAAAANGNPAVSFLNVIVYSQTNRFLAYDRQAWT